VGINGILILNRFGFVAHTANVNFLEVRRMSRACAHCGKKEEGEEHHLIPKFIFEYSGIEGNPDLYRIILCKKCHKEVTEIWEKIRLVLKKRYKKDE